MTVQLRLGFRVHIWGVRWKYGDKLMLLPLDKALVGKGLAVPEDSSLSPLGRTVFWRRRLRRAKRQADEGMSM